MLFFVNSVCVVEWSKSSSHYRDGSGSIQLVDKLDSDFDQQNEDKLIRLVLLDPLTLEPQIRLDLFRNTIKANKDCAIKWKQYCQVGAIDNPREMRQTQWQVGWVYFRREAIINTVDTNIAKH